MTDEEMAEAYANCFKEYSKTNRGALKQAFLAGLKDGAERYKTKWHKVADGDLPPIENYIYTIDVLTDKGDIAYYVYNYNRWCVEPSGAVIEPPVAWCEIPTYIEEV